ncbi:uncharacterized protein METZ01_LOCUS464278, partial [marine metagenome]
LSLRPKTRYWFVIVTPLREFGILCRKWTIAGMRPIH